MSNVAKTVIASIDVTKIDKSKCFQGKNGALYLDLVLINTPDNQYGNTYMAVQGVSKEEREQGVKGAILGNAKVFGAGEGTANTGGNGGGSAPAADGNVDSMPF
jgi:hypothetical protein